MEDILKKKKIKVTDTRKEILRILSESDSAISYNSIQDRTEQKLDKVTVYRTLETFEKKGIIHSIPSEEGQRLYSFCMDDCEDHHHHEDEHVHFKCDNCGNTTCLYDVSIPKITLPKNHKYSSSKLIVQGICPNCV